MRNRKRTDTFTKDKDSNKMFWVDDGSDRTGVWEFSFDKKKVYNMFEDYPAKLTPDEKAIFDKENPFWADFFRGRE